MVELESSGNGEVLSLLHLKGRVLSSHSDGTIKVWIYLCLPHLSLSHIYTHEISSFICINLRHYS